MKYSYFLCLFMILMVIVPVSAAPVINPVVQSEPFLCRFWLTGWVCGATGTSGTAGGTGSQGIPGINGTGGGDINYFNFSGSNLTTISNITNFFNYTSIFSEMNQTPGEQGIQGIPGAANMTAGTPGTNGTDGNAATIVVNFTFTGAPGSSAIVSNIGSSSAASLDFTVPAGTTGTPGTNGTNGTAATITINYTFTGSPGTNAQVTNIGTALDAIFDIIIPSGIQGIAGTNGSQGNSGTPGTNGTSASVTVNNTVTLNSGQAATVTNIGNVTSVILDFGIPKGSTGEAGTPGTPGTNGTAGAPGTPGTNGTNGENGAAATIAVNNTLTLIAGQPATVTNIGTSGAASLDFGVPQGAKGDKGDTGDIPDASQFLFINGSRAMSGNLSMASNYITGLLSPSISTDAATKGYVDALPIYNASYWTGTNYNVSYWTGTNYNATYATQDYVGGVNSSMKGYVDGQISGVSNYNASYWTGTNYNASYLTSTFNATYDAKTNYNASYWTGTNYNASYLNKDGSVALTGNLSIGSKYINNLITGGLGSDAVNKSYVDAVNATGITDHGALTGLPDDDHERYFDKNGGKALTGTTIMRSDDTSYLDLTGGTTALGRGWIRLTGPDYTGAVPAGIRMFVGNAAGSNQIEILQVVGKTDTPVTNWQARRLTNIADPTSAQDAATKNYVDTKQKCGATATVADGGIITHTFGATPTYVLATGSIAAEGIAVTAKNATTATLAIKKYATGLAGTTQTVYWCVG